ncbi:hypothetical protein [Terriglobus albidus]|uniref:hypothetical protein n=1 Tax=Terriglobus albidus TaxID=1592106 RepID=UPI0021DF847B|nr:hypothetical protein [Terriglobus albidus]
MLDSNAINAAVLFALLTSGGDALCVSHMAPVQSQIQQARGIALPSQAAPSKKPPLFSAPGRLDMAAPSHDFKLAEESEITLRPHAPGLTAVETQQIQYQPDDVASRQRPHFPEGGAVTIPISYHPDGSATIKIVPRLLGHIVLRINAIFPDGGTTTSEITLNIRPSDQSPEKLIVSDFPWIRTFLDPKEPVRSLTVRAIYKNLKEEVTIDPSFASFHVRNANNSAPVISMDATKGLIKPLRIGDALVETSFGGWTNLTCITVNDHYDPNLRDPFDCKSLLRPGEKAAMSIRK